MERYYTLSLKLTINFQFKVQLKILQLLSSIDYKFRLKFTSICDVA